MHHPVGIKGGVITHHALDDDLGIFIDENGHAGLFQLLAECRD
jgi:hypothetical protein